MAVGEGGRGRREREMSSRSDGQPSKSGRPHRLDACGFSRKLVINVYLAIHVVPLNISICLDLCAFRRRCVGLGLQAVPTLHGDQARDVRHRHQGPLRLLEGARAAAGPVRLTQIGLILSGGGGRPFLSFPARHPPTAACDDELLILLSLVVCTSYPCYADWVLNGLNGAKWR